MLFRSDSSFGFRIILPGPASHQNADLRIHLPRRQLGFIPRGAAFLQSQNRLRLSHQFANGSFILGRSRLLQLCQQSRQFRVMFRDELLNISAFLFRNDGTRDRSGPLSRLLGPGGRWQQGHAEHHQNCEELKQHTFGQSGKFQNRASSSHQ